MTDTEASPLLPQHRPNSDSSRSRRGDTTPSASDNGDYYLDNDDENENGDDSDGGSEVIDFERGDEENPKNWPLKWKYLQVFLVFIIALTTALASSIMAPGIGDIAKTFNVSTQMAIGAQTGFVCMLGVGPLFWAPMSETFGRRPVFVINLLIFTLLQIPIALSPNMACFIVVRTMSGFFGSVGVANGGGSVADLFETHERATVLGFYLLGPLLGPSLGPLFGAMILARYQWRVIFWLTLTIATVVTVVCFFLLYETRAPTILQKRKAKLEAKDSQVKYKVKGASNGSLFSKIASNSTRASKILFTQPIVLIMSAYQALIFSSMYSLYSNYDNIWSNPPYNFTTSEVGLTYLGPTIGFIGCALLVVPFIDQIYERLGDQNNNDGMPEYRLPLANIGAVFLPVSLFWFGWTVEMGYQWTVPLTATLFFGAAQVSIFNTVQNYYIDAFQSNAASALAAGAFLRSVVGGVVPLFVGKLFEAIGYGWGMSVFGFIAVVLMPAPLLFFWYGERLRERFAIDL